ncbi:MAG TPA: gamma-glutamylcyclotransferase [Rhodoblastus sp.]|nr:gamma-glutamylcyclotransferase [Rhodoblastus sp.]
MPLYFAYGSNMDAAAMRARCPNSRPLGRARLARHRFALMADGYATVVRDPNSEAHGVLYDLALSDVPALDRYEEVSRGLYAKAMQPALRADGRPVRALVYIGSAPAFSGPAKKPDYMKGVIAAARAAELPAAYVDFLSGLLSGGVVAAPQRRAIKWSPPGI